MQRPANVQITQLVNNQKTVLYLCESCAGAREKLLIDLPFNMSNLLSSIMENMHGVTQVPIKGEDMQCDVCGMSYDEFTHSGKFGCWNCYNSFSQRLDPIFRRLHGNTKHTGKVPTKVDSERKTAKEIYNLRLMLKDAVKVEKYEEAARIRDKIKALEEEQKRMGGVQ